MSRSAGTAKQPPSSPGRAFVRLALHTFVASARGALARLAGRRRDGAVWRQMHQMGNRSLLFILVTLGFLGVVLVFQTCLQVSRITGDLSLVGAEFIKLMVHEFGPTLTALMLATRVGAGIAAEIGSMAVTEQLDALRMNDVDPADYLIAPRLLASLVMTGVLTVAGIAAAIAMGALTAYQSFHVNPHVFLDLSRVRPGDLVTGAIKCLAYGAAVPTVAGLAGLGARGGSEGVGQATTRAVISASFVVIVLDFVISGVALYTLQRGGA